MRGLNLVLAALLALLTATSSFTQSTNGTVSGTIEDSSRALIPGVTVTATNTGTDVTTTVLSNESGAYSFSSLLPGTYKVSASLPGFQTQTYTDVRLGNADQVRLNFTLKVGAVNTTVEVSIPADSLLAVSSSSVGEVINQQRVTDLPTVTNNVLDIYRLIPGIRIDDTGNTGSVSGLGGLGTVNITRDGVDNVGAARFGGSLQGATYMSPDLIGEVRIVVAPVDAEVGRGNGQFQFLTRSGTSEYHGTGVWTVRNTALDANTWANNRATDPKTGAWKPTEPNWYNNHQLTGSFGGPIVKNKTFFFVLGDWAIMNGRTTQNVQVLTPCARKGIFRYYDGWNNGNYFSPTTTGTTPTIAVVDALGNPVAPATTPTGAPFAGSLHYASVFGTVLNPTTINSDCSNAQIGPATGAGAINGAWDQYRVGVDSTGFVNKLMGQMPSANNYELGDGLNTAGFRWTRNEKNGSENIFAVGPATSALTGDARKQINAKVDHNFNTKNRLSVSYTYENSSGNANYENWPGGFRGKSFRHPQLLSGNFTSTLSPTLINEARVGMRRVGGNTSNGLTNPDTGLANQAFFPNYGGYPVMIGLGTGSVNFQSNQILGGGTTADYHDLTNLVSFTDSVSWSKDKHTFKFGGEVRLTHSLGYDAGITVTSIPRALGGDAPNAQIPSGPGSPILSTNPNFAGLAGNSQSGNNQALRNLLTFLSGSLNQITQFYYVQDPKNLDTFENYQTYPNRIRDTVQNEGDIFFKDDWKIMKSLTLNLGLRWEKYGVPYESHGLMVLPTEGQDAIFGVSGRSFDGWMKPGERAGLTVPEFVGKNSPKPDTPWYQNDYKNFGPAIGFAWQVPFWGEGRTTIRGGYQMTFQQGQVPNALTQENIVPGSTYNGNYQGDASVSYLDLTSVQSFIPVPIPIKPMQGIPIYDRQQQIYIPSNNVRNPYAQNITLSLTRSINRNLSVDVRYIGTLGRRQWNVAFDTNVPNFLYNGLKEAFDAARSGDDSSASLNVLEQMFQGINIAGTGCTTATGASTPCAPVGTVNSAGVLQTAGMHLRASTNFNTNLANGNYFGLAGTLNTLNYNKTFAGNATLPDFPAGSRGSVIRNSGLFPENFVVTNPQFTSTFMIASMNNNQYHSLETQITLRPWHGLSMQGSYTWSRNNGLSGGAGLGNSYTNPVDRHADYTVTTDTRKHEFRTNGSFDLPMGPNKLFFTNSSGVLARVLENWKAGWIVNLISGAPSSITGQSMLYASGTPDVVGPLDTKNPGVTWGTGSTANSANYFTPGAFQYVKDPQCAGVTTAQNLSSLCTLQAVRDTRINQIVLQNPQPGTRGTLGQRAVYLPGTWRFDANLSKRIQLAEARSLEFRMDASNILNHPEPGTPSLNINSTTTPFGAITGNAAKNTQHRQLQAQMRFNF